MIRRVLAAGSTSLGESPLWPTVAIVAAAGLYADLPSRFIAGTSAGAFSAVRWIVPALTVILLAALLASVPEGPLMRALGWLPQQVRVTRRWLTVTMIAIVSAANSASIYLLVHLLINGAHANAPTLLRAAVHMWVVNVLLFGLWFWQLDAGGPAERPKCLPHKRDFLFPQQAEPALMAGGWEPKFLDYLYVSFTNAAALSPTDTLPLSRWAKMLMLVQSAISLSLAVMVVARAVNILK
ncbi:MAG TPA: hypothetical protein VFW41_03470 [Gaiellaceae bacterium]|nr:hypothetical protein [Gaiellaceae bacterium]